MKFSLKWLSDHTQTESFFKDPKQLASKLALSGFEADSIEDLSLRFQNIVTVRIDMVKKHPQADRLSVCKVSTGERVFSIVCGASNPRAGDRAVLALPGAVLSSRLKIKKSRIRGVESEGMLCSKEELGLDPKDPDLPTKQTEDQTGQNAKSEQVGGIWLLPPETPIGQSLAKYLQMDDLIFEISIPPNRPDCLSHKGLAREISSLFSLPFFSYQTPPLSNSTNLKGTSATSDRAETLDATEQVNSKTTAPNQTDTLLDAAAFPLDKPSKETQTDGHYLQEVRKLASLKELPSDFFNSPFPLKKQLPLQVEREQDCPRYLGQAIKGLKVKSSPLWLKLRLKSVGLKPINNVADVTNFVLRDMGRPLHAFDMDKIKGKVSVSLAKKGERFLALDGQEMILKGEELCIRDERGVLALAGGMGGMESSIQEGTKNVFIECALFQPERIRKMIQSQGIDSLSGYHFARGLDFFDLREALHLACLLIQREAGGAISKEFYDISAPAPVQRSIKIHLSDLRDRLGFEVSGEAFKTQMKKTLSSVYEKEKGQKAESKEQGLKKDSPPSSSFHSKPSVNDNKLPSPEEFEVHPPSFRQDLKLKEDLIEEFARLSGYDKIPESLPPTFSPPGTSDPDFLNTLPLVHFLVGKGFFQTINYSFCDPNTYRKFVGERLFLDELLSSSSPCGAKKSFSIQNPLSELMSLMKPLLSPDIVQRVIYNFRRENKQGRIFELSPVFYQEEEGQQHQQEKSRQREGQKEQEGIKQEKSQQETQHRESPQAKNKQGEKATPEKTTVFKQKQHLGLSVWGQEADMWQNKPLTPNVYYIKSILDALFQAFRLRGLKWEQQSSSSIPFLHPSQTLILKTEKGQGLGFLGSLHPGLLKDLKISSDLALAELDWEQLFQNGRKPFKFRPVPSLSAIEKDLCFVIPSPNSKLWSPKERLKAEDLRQALQKSLHKYLQKNHQSTPPSSAEIKIFDVYERGTDERSISFRIRLQPPDKAFTEADIQQLLKSLISSAEAIGAKLLKN